MIYVGYDKYSSLLSYRYGRLKEHGLWNIAVKTVRYTRRYFFISRLIRYASYIATAIETSAVLIIVFSVILALLPVVLVIFGITALISVMGYRRYNKLISDDIANARIVVIDAKKGYFRAKERYLNNMARCFKNEGYTVLVISHSFTRDRFLTARKAEERVWVMKLNYFFVLKKQLDPDRLIYIY